ILDDLYIPLKSHLNALQLYNASIVLFLLINRRNIYHSHFSEIEMTLDTYQQSLPTCKDQPLENAIDSDRQRAIECHHKLSPHVFGRLVRSEEHTSELQSRFDLVCR